MKTKTQAFRIRIKNLRDDQASWRSHWKEIAEYTVPRKGKYLDSNTDDSDLAARGDKMHKKIINGTGGDSLKILAAGMQGGMTSPSRPWFVLGLEDKELMQYSPVKQWLTDVRNTLLGIYGRSNFYGSMHNMYKEIGAFGVASQLQDEDFKTVVRFRPFTIGEYMLSLDAQYRPASLFRTFSLSAEQVVEKFGEENVSEMVKAAIKSNNLDTRFMINHVIGPNDAQNDEIVGTRGMPYYSVYFEEMGDPDVTLREKGYESLPFIAPRWDVVSTDTYGTSPGMEALGDIKMLQKMEEKTLKAIDKMVDPPMNAHPSLKNKGGSIVPGHVNYISSQQGQVGFSPVYQVNPNVQQLEYKIDRVEQRVKRFFFNDLFLMIVNDQRSNTTAYEIAKKHEEKLLMLGPVLERIQSESHDPTIDRTFQIAERFGLIPPMPEEMQGQAIKVEYISLLAQAQKMVGTTSIEQTTSFIGNLASVNPEALDKLDIDQAIDQYADLTGAPPKMIRSDLQVQELRARRAQAQQQQALAERAATAPQDAKTMSETKLNEDSVLDRLMGNI